MPTATKARPAPHPAPPPAHPAPPAASPAARAAARLAPFAPLLPAVAVVLLLCAPVSDEGSPGSRVTLADAASGVLVVHCAVRLLRDRRRPLSRLAVLLIAAPAVAFAVATATSWDPAASLPGFVRYLQIFVLVPAAVLLLLRDRADFRVLAGAVLCVAVVQGGVGVHQYLTGTGASYQGQDIRAVGTFGPLDVMGMSTVVAYGIVIALAAGLAPPAGSPRWLRPAALGSAAALLVPLALSFSRGAWIATAAAVLAVLLLAGLRLALGALALLTAAAVVLVGGVGVGSEQIGQRLGSITQVTAAPDQSVTDRYTMWAAATAMWRDSPATGVGLKGFPAHRDGHASLALSSGSDTAGAGRGFHREPLLSPHNMYLLVLSEQGLIGLTALAGGWLALLACALRRLRAGTRGGLPADCGLIAAGLLVWQLVDFVYADIGGPSTVLTAVMIGLAAWWGLHPQTRPGSGAAAR
ncbi:O-antigen ligase family protein [Streptomyces sp. 549]|uniref:O-antigen ligase family protein n=1 Tax=Streptomyces sp. 549 TaxID=3049076 RepID=UPI0024C25DA7|nr:O-antigen ligase family protein [Streptomyces sp. 549]MDK1473573.1 O-antigen ligase family protein [Streptomyces sp. 549]